jgi:hypothetical protein
MKKLYLVLGLLCLSLTLFAEEDIKAEDTIQGVYRDLRITPQFGYSYYYMSGENHYSEYKPNAFVDITYLINKSFEIGFGLGIDSLTIAKLGSNVTYNYDGPDKARDIVVPIYMVLRYNMNFNDNHSLVLSGKFGSIASNYYQYNAYDSVYQTFDRITLSANSFLGASIGYGYKQWLVSVDYLGYVINRTYSHFTPTTIAGQPYYFQSDYFSQNFANKVGISLAYRFDFPLVSKDLKSYKINN